MMEHGDLSPDPQLAPVVMVDDNAIDIFMAKKCYMRSELPNEFIALQSGAEFLAYLADVAKGDKTMPATVLLDINMPGLDGFDVLKAVREQERFQKIPIIVMLTNSDSQKDIDLALELGANRFQTKPNAVQQYVDFFASLKGLLAPGEA